MKLPFMLRAPDDLDDEYYRCLCGIRSHSYVRFCAIMNIVVSTFACISFFLLENHGAVPIAAVGFFFGMLLLYGNTKRLWWAYLPELCLQITYVITNFLVSIGFIVYAIYYSYVYMTVGKELSSPPPSLHDRIVPSMILLFGAILQVVFSFVHAYLASVFVRGFQFVLKHKGVYAKRLPEYYDY